jgi:hypothetical protein
MHVRERGQRGNVDRDACTDEGAARTAAAPEHIGEPACEKRHDRRRERDGAGEYRQHEDVILRRQPDRRGRYCDRH